MLENNSFSPREVRYLRISKTQVLQMILYTKPEYTSWFSDHVFQLVLAALQPLIPKKISDSKSKDPPAEIYRSGVFQMAYTIVNSTQPRHYLLLQNAPVKVEEEESFGAREKQKDFTYDGFTIYKKALVVVVEPYDPHRTVEVPDFITLERKTPTIRDYIPSNDAANGAT
ncbi:hypothetical protein K493DRAFT_320469 [Basidiobolus meristosporus CBS 931.73]|uniref:Uncharacterized protein n=1 Tax=Basidiobolus meristosporus CBS 931.73 TaxID=1314790 RepID=A0A1Y1X9C1_9FUNG|nr:hypothetical protein K493DRAFT_320469 [Basidiobolus meristosporus CBS 931.73]|eukprot:ORX82352.1 hypothetical protein K493DRAFT_320469 [Basidiobolus meristosporus CBS 931.73]